MFSSFSVGNGNEVRTMGRSLRFVPLPVLKAKSTDNYKDNTPVFRNAKPGTDNYKDNTPVVRNAKPTDNYRVILLYDL